MKTEILIQKPYTLAIVGFILCIPAFYLVTTGVLFSLFGLNMIDPVQNTIGFILHPIIILGGLGLAFALNILPVVQTRLVTEKSSLVITIFFKDRVRNILLILMCLTLLGAILLYGIVENFDIIPR